MTCLCGTDAPRAGRPVALGFEMSNLQDLKCEMFCTGMKDGSGKGWKGRLEGFGQKARSTLSPICH